MKRRDFLAQVAAGTAVGLLHPRFSFSQESQPAIKRPNFLIIITDDQRWDALSVVQAEQGDRARFPWLKTPNLDRLAETGVRFRNAFCVFSLCSPSRANFLSGQYGKDNGVLNNLTDLPSSTATYGSILRDAGYKTTYVGKWHMGHQTERPGFEESYTFVEQGAYFDCEFLVNGKPQATEGWVDDVATDYALEFLRKQSDQQPFVLSLGFKTPHDDYQPPPRHVSTYEGESSRPVPNLGRRGIYERIDKGLTGNAGSSMPASAPQTARERNRPREELNYMRCITAIDDNVGRLLDELSKLGLDQNTVVVFAGDNGFNLGEHGMWNKRDAYEESMRIPLLMRYPPFGAGKKVDEIVLSIDLAPTVLQLAGVSIPASMKGRSWAPLLDGSASEWRETFYFQYRKERPKMTLPSIDAVRTQDAKLILYEGHEDVTELFDLSSDPYEVNNLANDPAKRELLEDLRARLEKLKREAIGE